MYMTRINWICVVISVYICDVIALSTTDSRWQLQPDRKFVVVSDTHISLIWRYTLPKNTMNQGRILFSHHFPDKSYEDLLLRGTIHPVYGLITPEEILYPERMSIETDYGSIKIDLHMTSYFDTGRYMLDIDFAGEDPMHDQVQIDVYDKEQLQPTIKLNGFVVSPTNATTYHINPGQLIIIFSRTVPSPNLELFSLRDGTTQVYVKGFNVSFLEVMMTSEMLLDDLITLGVYYGFYHETYDFILELPSTGSSTTASSNMIGLLVLIPLVVILIIIIILMVCRQKKMKKEKKYEQVPKEVTVEMRTISGRSGMKPSDGDTNRSLIHDASFTNSVSTERDNGYHSNSMSRTRDPIYSHNSVQFKEHRTSSQQPGAKLSLVIEHDKNYLEPAGWNYGNDQKGKRRGSHVSDGSNKKSRSTITIKSVYERRDVSERDGSTSTPAVRRSFVSSPSLHITPPKPQTGSRIFSYPSQSGPYDTGSLRPKSNLPRMYSKSKSQDNTLDDDVFYTRSSGISKPKSASTLPNMNYRYPSSPDYNIKPATGDKVCNSVPAFLLRRSFRDQLNNNVTSHDATNNNSPGISPVANRYSKEATV